MNCGHCAATALPGASLALQPPPRFSSPSAGRAVQTQGRLGRLSRLLPAGSTVRFDQVRPLVRLIEEASADNQDKIVGALGNGERASGALAALAIGSKERLKQTPDVPTFKELGYDNLNLSINRGIVAPKEIDPAKVETLAQGFEAMSQDPKFVERVNKAGAEVEFMGPQAYADYLAEVDATVKRLSGKLAR